jgi:hypothetical protein
VNRFASTLILAVAPLLAVGVLTQSEGVSINSMTDISSIARNSGAAKQSFRGYWLDGSNFTQDAGYSASGFLSGGIFAAATNRTDFGGRHTASASSNSHQNFQVPQRTSGNSISTKSRLDAQLENFNALYAYLATRGVAAAAAVSPAIYRQLVDQQFAARTFPYAPARTHFTYGSIADAGEKSAGVSAADLQRVEIAAQHTEHAADIRDVTVARMKKTMQQRVYMQRPAPPQPNRLSGQAEPGRAEQNQRAAFAAMQVAYTGTKVFAEVAPIENLRRATQPESSSNAGCENPSRDAKPADQIELKVKIGAPIK